MQNKILELTEALDKRFGKKTIDNLIADDKLVIVSLEQARKIYDVQIPSQADGFYLNSKAILIADNLTTKSVSATFLHELGGHGGFQTLLPKNIYKNYLERFNTLVAENDQLAVQAYYLAHKNSPNNAEDEYIPYLITLASESREKSPKVNQFIKDMVSHAKLFINEKFGVNIKLNTNDFEILAKKQIDEIAYKNTLELKNSTQAKFSQQIPSDEIEMVKLQYENTDRWLKAPNGEPTLLSEQQWLQVRTPSFKAWFGDWEHDPDNASKVISNNGEPLVVFHGGTFDVNSDKAVFDKNRQGQNYYESTGGFFFTDRQSSANYYAGSYQEQPTGQVTDVFLNIRSPKTGRTFESYHEAVDAYDRLNESIQIDIKNNQLDGVIFKAIDEDGDYDGGFYVTTEPNQIKSATYNFGTFDKNNDDIRFSFAREPINFDYNYASYDNIGKILEENTNKALKSYAKDIARFNNSIDKVIGGDYGRGYVPVGRTPDVLKILGVPDTKVRIKEQHLEKVMATHLNIPDGKYETPHNVTPETLKQIPSEIHNPIAIFKSSTRDNSYLLLTEQYEQKVHTGKNSPIVVIFNVNAGKDDIDIINIGSIYGRSQGQLLRDFTDNLLYLNKEKGQKFLNTERLQLPWDFTSDTSNLSYNYKTEQDLSQYILSKNLQKAEQLKGLEMPNNQTERDYIYAPYEDKDKVKALGAKYDPDVKMWYIPEGIDKNKFSQWASKPQTEYASPEYEFKKFLQSFGADIPAGHPIADGRWHSLHIQGDKSNSKKGGYIVTEENGVWRGSFNNFKTGQTAYFSSKSHSHTHTFTPPEEIERIQRERAEAQAKLYAYTAESASKILAVARPATDYPYLAKKGVQAHGLYVVPQPELAVQDGNIRIAHDWREARAMRDHFKENGDRISVLTAGDLMIPAYDKDGNISTIQTIGRDKNNFKSFLTDGQKAGSFLVLGEIKNNEPILIAEGYATGATLHETIGKPVVVAFDAGNLKNVALTVREKFPDSVIYMAADNDHKTAREREALGHTTNLNTGIEKATEAAVAVGGYVVAPKFSEHDSGSDWNDVLKDKGVVELRDQFRTQLVDIGLQRNLDLSIKKVEFADKEIQRVQETVMLTAFKDKDKIIKDYSLHEKTFEGRYIASDMMKEMFSQYNQSPEHRNKHNNAVHNTAAALAAKHFNDTLDKPIENGRDTVVFLTGSPGAGKTSTVLNKGSLQDNVAVVFEGQLANAHQNPASMDKIQKALERGYKVEIVAVNPKPEQALENTFKRFYDSADGRGSSIATMARIQGNTYDGLKAVHDKFGDNVKLTIIDKPHGNNGQTKYVGWEHLDVLKSQGTEAQIKERLSTHLLKQYEIGAINNECFKQAAGADHERLNARMAERGSRAFSQDESRREFSSGSSSTSNQLGERENARTSGETGRMGGSTSQLSETESGAHRPHRQSANVGKGGSEPARAGGTYTGHIISVGEDVTIQKTRTGKLIIHETENLPGIKEHDTSNQLKIVYGANGKGDIVQKSNDLEIGKEKEMGLGGGGKP